MTVAKCLVWQLQPKPYTLETKPWNRTSDAKRMAMTVAKCFFSFSSSRWQIIVAGIEAVYTYVCMCVGVCVCVFMCVHVFLILLCLEVAKNRCEDQGCVCVRVGCVWVCVSVFECVYTCFSFPPLLQSGRLSWRKRGVGGVYVCVCARMYMYFFFFSSPRWQIIVTQMRGGGGLCMCGLCMCLCAYVHVFLFLLLSKVADYRSANRTS